MSTFRSFRQLANLSTRALTLRSVPRSLVNSRSQLAQLARISPAIRQFSASVRSLGEGSSDISLSQKLQEEIKFEQQEAEAAGSEPEFLKEFTSQGVWKVQDVHGQDEVALTRTFGNESIRLIFSIADIENQPEYPAEEEGEENENATGAYPIRCSFTVTKSAAKGAVSIDALCQEGTFIVDNISFYSDAKLATELTAEADWKRRGLYIGPQFDQLDPSVQEEFEKYFEERGINENLALFIPEYAQYKEQKEYVNWLTNVKTFVEN